MNKCEYYQQLISLQLDGELNAAQERELAEHLRDCADCRSVDAAFRALSEGFADYAEEAPAELCENVMSGIRRKSIKISNARRKPRAWKPLLATAACFVLIVAAAGAAGPLLRAGALSSRNEIASSAAMDTTDGAAPAEAPADGADAAAGYAETPEAAYESQRAIDEDGVLGVYTGEPENVEEPIYYELNGEQFEELIVRLGGEASEMPAEAADESIVAVSESGSLYISIYGERVFYNVDGGENTFESEMSAAELREILAFFAE